MALYKLLAAGAAAVLLAGCSSGNGDPPLAATSSKSPDVGTAMLALTRCFRSHGYPSFPDPTQDPQSGAWRWPDSAPGRVNAEECDALGRQTKDLIRKQEERVNAAEMAMMRQYATCMRQQGVSDWPDPNSDGTFSLPPRLAGRAGMNLVRQQDKVCRRHLSGGKGIRVREPGQSGGK